RSPSLPLSLSPSPTNACVSSLSPAAAAGEHRSIASSNVGQVHYRFAGWIPWHCICLRRHRFRQEDLWRHCVQDGDRQGVVSGHGRQVPGLAPCRRAAGRHEPHQPPELHRQGPLNVLRRKLDQRFASTMQPKFLF
uniref:Uncharacterized protein n=1 Tax=Triticum urartu TaxID=4572 RepID=A0A8R7UZG9_TRIUA